jgi:MOSC domain-containing protein YiiM
MCSSGWIGAVRALRDLVLDGRTRQEGQMKDPEDEAFDELALKQGQWHHISGWRKKQIAHMDVHSHPAEFVHLHRNDTLEEVAKELETKFTGPFGRDTVQSFAIFVRSMKK